MKPNYEIVEDTATVLCLRDLGPWPPHLTITNGVEEVVAELAGRLGTRRLEYYDSEGDRGQILVRDGKFVDFERPGITVLWVKQEPLMDKDYLGDSVYAQHDGYHIVLTTENGRPDDPSNRIALEPSVLAALHRYVARIKEKYAAQAEASAPSE